MRFEGRCAGRCGKGGPTSVALTSGAAAAEPTATRAVELAATLDPAPSSACNGRTCAANGGISREAGHGTRCGAHTLTIMSAVDGAASCSAERAAAAAATSTCASAKMARISARRVSIACECVGVCRCVALPGAGCGAHTPAAPSAAAAASANAAARVARARHLVAMAAARAWRRDGQSAAARQGRKA